MSDKPKRSSQISVRMAEEDIALLRKAAAARWPDAPVSLASTAMIFALERAREILAKPSTVLAQRKRKP